MVELHQCHSQVPEAIIDNRETSHQHLQRLASTACFALLLDLFRKGVAAAAVAAVLG